MAEWKYYVTLDRVFPFVEAFRNRVTGVRECSPMTRVQSTYPELLLCEKDWERGNKLI